MGVFSWRLISTGPALEGRIAGALRMHLPKARAGDIYIPMETVWRRGVRRKLGAYDRPLIRGYVFAALADQELPLIHEVSTSARLVVLGGRMVTVSPADVLSFREAEAAGVFDETRPVRVLDRGGRRAVGDEVRIIDGPLMGFIGKVSKLRGDRRAKVLLALLAGKQTVDVALDSLELANPPQAETVKVA